MGTTATPQGAASEDRAKTDEERRAGCRHCFSVVRLNQWDELEQHAGPCGRGCIGGGVPMGDPFHDEFCMDPRCITTREVASRPRERGYLNEAVVKWEVQRLEPTVVVDVAMLLADMEEFQETEPLKRQPPLSAVLGRETKKTRR